MGRFSFCLRLFLLSALLLLSFTHGFGRNLMQMPGNEDNSALLLQENGGISREMIELDYDEPGPNTNPKSGFLLPPPSPPPGS